MAFQACFACARCIISISLRPTGRPLPIGPQIINVIGINKGKPLWLAPIKPYDVWIDLPQVKAASCRSSEGVAPGCTT